MSAPDTSMRHPAADHSAGARRLVNARQPRLYDDDPLAAARGLIVGIPIGIALWALIALAWWAL